MIASNELRIGNYVKTITDKTAIIKEITEGSFNGTVRVQDLSHYDEDILFGYGCSEISGIELSSDILIKAGFEKMEEPHIFGKARYRYYVDYGWFYQLSDNDDEVLLNDEIDFVHQLQNLYFALIGTELNITI